MGYKCVAAWGDDPGKRVQPFGRDDRYVDFDLMTKQPTLKQDQDATLSVELQIAFGENVRAARSKVGLSQAELAERTGIAREDISRIENGQSNPTLRTMSRLASVLDGDVARMLQASQRPHI